MDRIGVTARDLRRVRSLLDPDRPAAPGDDVPPSLLHDLAELVPSEDVTFQVMDHRRRFAVTQSTLPDDGTEDPALDALFWDGFWESLACSYPQRTGDHTTVARCSDFSGRAAFSRTTMGAYLAACGVRHEALVPLPVLDVYDRRLLLFRTEGSDFTERELLLLSLLRPHLIEMHMRQLRRRRGVPELTPRQWEILRLVAAGCTNRMAARALNISEATVRKHLENLYGRLEVNSRTEALARISPTELHLHTSVA
ncbi:MAG TPA: LuxR C-terminal-related transcriptional regulator [Actinomycetales bacterium]|nr:LuxR C-terminal-related transcriptional regulator [Actinomycetales bacterium]